MKRLLFIALVFISISISQNINDGLEIQYFDGSQHKTVNNQKYIGIHSNVIFFEESYGYFGSNYKGIACKSIISIKTKINEDFSYDCSENTISTDDATEYFELINSVEGKDFSKKDDYVNKGIGIALTSWPSLFQTNNYNVLTIVFPTDRIVPIIIEPEISYYRYHSLDRNNNEVLSSYSVRLLLGLFYQSHKNKMTLYSGARFGPIFEENGTGENSVTIHQFAIAPTMGAHYFLSDNISIGVEGSIVRIIVEDIDNPSLKSVTATVSRLTIRYYY